MTAIVLMMLFCVGVAVCVLALVIIPARRQGKVLLTERGEDVVAGVRERSDAVTARASGAVDRVRARRADRRPGEGEALVGVDHGSVGHDEALAACDPTGAVFLGCTFTEAGLAAVRDRGAVVFPTVPDVPVNPYRAHLYSPAELFDPLPDGHYADSLDTPRNKQFRDAYAQQFKLQPDVYAVQGYDSGQLLVQGLAAVKGDMSNKPALYKALESAVIDSPRGKWTMSKAHNPVQDIYLRVVEKGDNKVLGVAAKALADSGAGCKLA